MPGTDPKNRVDARSTAYERMATKWPLVMDLRGGTLAMRKAGSRWLPQEPKELREQYLNRLNRSVLFNGYSDTVNRLAGKPFSKEVAIEDAPTAVEMLADNADGSGRDITAFAFDVFTEMVDKGLSHIFIDYTDVPQGLTRADELEMEIRPTLIHVPAHNLLGWKTETIAGAEVLTQVRIREFRTEPDGLYGDRDVEYVRVVNAPTTGVANPILSVVDDDVRVVDPNEVGLGTWELHRKRDDGEEFDLVAAGTHTYPGVPWVTAYANRTGFMEGEPPMEDLAWLNMLHWQSLSDHRNILRFARVGLLFAAGFSAEEMNPAKPGGGIVIGPGRVVKSKNAQAKLDYVEYKGKAIDAGAADLRDLEERMQVLGLTPLVRRSGNQTATGKAIDEANSQSDLQSWVRRLENAMREAYRVAFRWVSTEDLPESFAVNIFNDFGISERSSEDISSLITMRMSREITHETFLREMKRRGVLTEDLDIDEEINAIESEGPSLGMIPPADDADAGDDEDEDDDLE